MEQLSRIKKNEAEVAKLAQNMALDVEKHISNEKQRSERFSNIEERESENRRRNRAQEIKDDRDFRLRILQLKQNASNTQS